MKKWFRSTTDKKIAGVIGGLAQYLNIDATLLRIITVIMAIITTVIPFLIIYLICIYVVPEEGEIK
ncbi:PspC domain-containing protein [Bacillus gobiensis]|uniref:PspC domain-containing protein n=1 Tax=Bacillus gobiensis TaxID=1441095 RepID=UPI003D23DED2